jgi:hypothetical protein
MIYVVYSDEGILKVKSKQIARRRKLCILQQFSNFYDAVEWIHGQRG